MRVAQDINFERFVDESLDLMCLARTDGYFHWVNASWERVLGWTPAELLARPFLELVHPDDRVATTAEMEKLKLGHLSPRFSNRYLCRDGSWRWLEWSTRPAGGGVLYANARDITQLKLAMDALERERAQATIRERRLELAVAATSDAIWEWNLETGETFYSPRWYEMLGQPDQSCPMTFEAWKELCHPDDFQPAVDKIQATLGAAGSTGYQAEFRMRHRNGGWIWILGRGNVVSRAPDGRALLLSGTNTDITERKLNEERQARSDRDVAAWKHRYDLLAAAAGLVVYDRLPTGEIVWGGGVEQMLGYAAEDMQGGIEQWRERIHPRDRDRVAAAFWRARDEGALFAAEYLFRDQADRYHLVEDTGYPYLDADGKLERFIGVMSDVTERRRADEDRQRLEESLRQAQKLESIGRLAGGVAHDFNNLLTAIRGNLGLALMGTGLDKELRAQLVEASRAVDLAAQVTRQLLAFSRKQPVEPRVLSLNDVVKELRTMLERFLGEDVAIESKLGPDAGHVKMDRGQLEQILVNLTVNARDAMPEGGTLTIETGAADVDRERAARHGISADERYVKLVVADTGQGMTDEVRARLFEPFFTTKEQGKGTGLGLAMVYGAVRQSGGALEVTSRLGRGTTFTLYFPTVEAPHADAGHTQTAAASPPGGKETVLLVEDEPAVRNIAQLILGRLGYEVRAYASGNEALNAVPQWSRPPDLLLTDVVMPGVTGRVLAQRLRQVWPSLKVLFTSGYDEDVTSRHGLPDAKEDLLPKPYSIAELARRVREALDR